MWAAAEALAVDDQAFAAARQGHVDTRDGDVGNRLEDGAQASFDTVDAPDRLDRELAVQVEREVGQFMAGGAQVDRALQRLVEERAS